jgi:hypothetical protein
MRSLMLVVLSLALATPGWATCPPIHRSATVLRQFQRLHPCPSTGRTTGACPGWVKDHIRALCLTGPAGDVVENLQWQTIHDARVKDIKERRECHVAPGHCAHQGD